MSRSSFHLSSGRTEPCVSPREFESVSVDAPRSSPDTVEAAERWLPVGGLPGVEASSTGRVRRVRDGRIVRQHPIGSGYLTAGTILLHDTPAPLYAHRAIAAAFLGLDLAGGRAVTVNHKNGVKTDNRLENLEVVSLTENIRHAFANGFIRAARGSEVKRSRLTEAQVADIIARWNAPGRRIGLRKQIAAEYGIDPSVISKLVAGDRWTHVPGGRPGAGMLSCSVCRTPGYTKTRCPTCAAARAQEAA